MSIRKTIPSFPRYEIDIYGNVYNKKTGNEISQKQRGAVVFLYKILEDGTKKRYGRTVARLVWETFRGEIPDGYEVARKSGFHGETFINDLYLEKKGTTFGKSGTTTNRKPVVKLDDQGNVISFYSSLRIAAEENHMSCMTLGNYCRRKREGRDMKSLVAPDGYIYAYEKDLEDKRKRKEFENKIGVKVKM